MVEVAARGVPRSHAEIAGAMPAYAAGVLTGRAEEVVRRHLSGGCRECLAVLFRHPVGLPRAERPRPAAPPPGDGAWRVVTAVLLVIALTGTVLASTMWLGARPAHRGEEDLSRRRAAALEESAAETRGLLASLSVRASRLEADLGSLPRATGTRDPGAMPSSCRASGCDGTERALGHLGSSLASPATRVERLRPAATAAGARGWLVWDPLRRRLFVYAVGLPTLPTPWETVVRVGTGAHRAPLRRLRDGGAWVALEPLAAGGCSADVIVSPPGADRVVLRGGLDVCPADPAA